MNYSIIGLVLSFCVLIAAGVRFVSFINGCYSMFFYCDMIVCFIAALWIIIAVHGMLTS